MIEQFPTYGSCKKGEYRLSGNDLDKIQNKLFQDCNNRVKNSSPCRVFQSYQYLDAGWEWSVFRDHDTVVKVPAGIFPETSDPRYLENTSYNYSVISKHIDPEFIADTQFFETAPNIQQPLLRPLPKMILFKECDAGKWRPLFEQLCRLLDAEEWLPDLDIRVSQSADGFRMRSVMTDVTKTPKIMDFTAYFDVFRLYEKKTRHEVRERKKVLQHIMGRLR